MGFLLSPFVWDERPRALPRVGVGLGVTIVPKWATNNLWPETEDMSSTLKGFRDGVEIVLSTGYW